MAVVRGAGGHRSEVGSLVAELHGNGAGAMLAIIMGTKKTDTLPRPFSSILRCSSWMVSQPPIATADDYAHPVGPSPKEPASGR